VSNQKIETEDTLHPQIIMMETPQESRVEMREPLAPRIIATAQTGHISAALPTEIQPTVQTNRRRRNLSMKLAVVGLAAAFCG